MLVRPLPPSFLITLSLSSSSFEYKALFIAITFLVLLYVYVSEVPTSSVSQGSRLSSQKDRQVFLHLIMFLLQSLVSCGFLVLLRNILPTNSFMSICLIVSSSKIRRYFYLYLLYLQVFIYLLVFLFLKASDYVVLFLLLFLISFIHYSHFPVCWGCRIHQLLLCRRVRPPPPQRVSWIWH